MSEKILQNLRRHTSRILDKASSALSGLRALAASKLRLVRPLSADERVAHF